MSTHPRPLETWHTTCHLHTGPRRLQSASNMSEKSMLNIYSRPSPHNTPFPPTGKAHYTVGSTSNGTTTNAVSNHPSPARRYSQPSMNSNMNYLHDFFMHPHHGGPSRNMAKGGPLAPYNTGTRKTTTACGGQISMLSVDPTMVNILNQVHNKPWKPWHTSWTMQPPTLTWQSHTPFLGIWLGHQSSAISATLLSSHVSRICTIFWCHNRLWLLE